MEKKCLHQIVCTQFSGVIDNWRGRVQLTVGSATTMQVSQGCVRKQTEKSMQSKP